MQIYNILRDKDDRELTVHGSKEFPCAGYDEKFSKFTHGEVPWHWHEELEIVIVLEGQTKVEFIGGERCLSSGEGIFINTNMLHKLTWEGVEECRIFSFVLKAELIGGQVNSRIFRKYIAPIYSNISLATVGLTPTKKWEKKALTILKSASESFKSNQIGYEITVLSKIMEFWNLFYCNVGCDKLPHTSSTSLDESRIRSILQFIHFKYMENIKIIDMAFRAGISESECFRLFNRVLKCSPGEYLMKYRLQKSADKILLSSATILEIALECGFNSSAYFTKRFKEYYGVTPKDFRKDKIAF